MNDKESRPVATPTLLRPANLVTVSRIVVAACLVAVWYLPISGAKGIAAVLFVIAAVTDFLDGAIARARGEESKLGAFLDLLADKVLTVLGIICIFSAYNETWLAISVSVILLRELIVTSAREWAAVHQQSGVLAASWLGKVKTTAMLTGISLLMFSAESLLPQWFSSSLYAIGAVVLVFSAVLSVISCVSYLAKIQHLLTD